MRYARKKRVLSGTALLFAFCLFVASVILVNASFTTLRLDLTENRLFTLSEGTLRILRELEEPVILNFYFSQRRLLDYPQLANYGVRVRDMLQEYLSRADGKLILRIIDPEPFSEIEDQAVATGMQSIPVGNSGERAWFGLAGVNSTDDEEVIPFFQLSREAAVEYDISRLIHNLAYPDRRVIGVTGSLPVFGDKKDPATEWMIIRALREFFEVRDLGSRPEHIDADIDTLVVIHPKDYSDIQYYNLEQYLLHGGTAMIFLDPLAEQDRSTPPSEERMIMPTLDSYMKPLLSAWGLEIPEEKLIGDIQAAMRVQARGPRGPREIDYLPWLRLNESNMNSQDLVSSQLNLIHLGTTGSIMVQKDITLQFSPLLQTSSEAMQLPRDLILFQPDPAVILNNFESENRRFTLAARIRGVVDSAYPNGRPVSEEGQPADPNFTPRGELHLILLADTDILADHFWVRPRTGVGGNVPQPVANNGDFVISAIENLSGSSALATLRTRGKYSRPFERVENMRKAAEAQFRLREQTLRENLEETEEKIRSLQQERGPGGQYLLTPKQEKELEQFRQLRLQIRKDLRMVQHELQKNIDSLGNHVRMLNIMLPPLLVGLAALLFAMLRNHARLRRPSP